MTVVIIIALIVLALVFVSVRYGHNKARRKTAEQAAKERSKDVEIIKDYRSVDLDSLRDRMRSKVRKHMP